MIHLVSTDPEDYGFIKFTSSLGVQNKVVMYRVHSLSFMASFSITTHDDFLTVRTNGEERTIRFPDHGYYNLPYDLNSVLAGFTVSMNNRGLLEVTSDKEFELVDASHRVKILMGMYHSSLPLCSSETKITMPSTPYVAYGNVLYLQSRTDMVCGVSNENGKEESLSLAYKVNEVLYPGFPVMCKLPGQWSVINSNQLNQLEFRLVDFQFRPVKLHSPLYLTLEVQELPAEL